MDAEKDEILQSNRSGDQEEPSSYARTELSGKRRGEGGTSLPDRVESTIGVVMDPSLRLPRPPQT